MLSSYQPEGASSSELDIPADKARFDETKHLYFVSGEIRRERVQDGDRIFSGQYPPKLLE
jgi:hypothetical protein